MNRDDYIYQRELARIKAACRWSWRDNIACFTFGLVLLYILWAAVTLACPWIVQYYMR